MALLLALWAIAGAAPAQAFKALPAVRRSAALGSPSSPLPAGGAALPATPANGSVPDAADSALPVGGGLRGASGGALPAALANGSAAEAADSALPVNGSARDGARELEAAMPPNVSSLLKSASAALPSNGSVLVVLRGEAMRTPREAWGHDGVVSGHLGCDPRGFDAQMNASRSVMANIVQPLVERQNTVDIIATEYPCRDWPRKLSEIYGVYRAHRPSSLLVERFREFARGQKQNFEWTLQSVGRHVRESDRYDMVVITRHDIIWKKPIVEWESLDPGKFNFASPCQGWRTVNDILHTMPGHMLSTFLDKPYWTHFDYDKAIKEYGKLGVEVGFALADSAEKMGGGVVRSENPWYEIY